LTYLLLFSRRTEDADNQDGDAKKQTGANTVEKFLNGTLNTINIEYENCEILVSVDLIRLYANFYQKDRAKTYDALDRIAEIQNMNEFKTKLLFSIIVVSTRHCSNYSPIIVKDYQSFYIEILAIFF
jgi:hypothetical protein